MIAFYASIAITLVLLSAVFVVARHRPPGQRLTWGEAFAAALWVFLLFVMIYGVVPDRFLRWADGDLGWRSDKIGIPTGPLPVNHKHLIWSGGFHVPFTGGHWYGTVGRVLINAQHIRDLIAATIYIAGLAVQFMLWSWWQKRSKTATQVAQAALTSTSAYGRPLTKPSQA